MNVSLCSIAEQLSFIKGSHVSAISNRGKMMVIYAGAPAGDARIYQDAAGNWNTFSKSNGKQPGTDSVDTFLSLLDRGIVAVLADQLS